MSYSGIVVCTRPASLAALAADLSDLPGVKVHQRDAATGRLILTLEAASIDEEIEGLRRIQCVPGVVSADLVYHCLSEVAGLPRSDQPTPTPSTPRGET